MTPKHIKAKKQSISNDNNAFIEAIPGVVFAVVISYVYLNVGTFMNGTLSSELVDSWGTNNATGGGDWRTAIENQSVETFTNISENFDDNVDIIKVAITISVLLIPIMAIMTLRRFI